MDKIWIGVLSSLGTTAILWGIGVIGPALIVSWNGVSQSHLDGQMALLREEISNIPNNLALSARYTTEPRARACADGETYIGPNLAQEHGGFCVTIVGK